MKKNTKRVLGCLGICISLLFVLIVGLTVFVVLSFKGIIPNFADTSLNAGYAGYQPSSGKVWEYAVGWGDGFKFRRLHLKPSSYGRLELVQILTTANTPSITHLAPWWWEAKPNGKTTILIGSGKGYDCKYYEIYDPVREILFTYEEWD